MIYIPSVVIVTFWWTSVASLSGPHWLPSPTFTQTSDDRERIKRCGTRLPDLRGVHLHRQPEGSKRPRQPL